MAYGKDKNKMGKKNLVKPPTNRVGTASKSKKMSDDLRGAINASPKLMKALRAKGMEKKDVRSAAAKAGAKKNNAFVPAKKKAPTKRGK
jgi:hypothetical protein